MSNEEHAAGPRPGHIERKLAAILHADVKGYSRLVGEDEVTTLRTVASHLDLMRSLVTQHGGRAVGSAGDSLLAEFPSVVEAVQAIEQAMRLDPHYPPWYLVDLGAAYNATGRYAEAITALKEASSRSPNLLPAHLQLSFSYLMQWAS